MAVCECARRAQRDVLRWRFSTAVMSRSSLCSSLLRAVRWHGRGPPTDLCCGPSRSAPTPTRPGSTAASTSPPSSGASCLRRPAGTVSFVGFVPGGGRAVTITDRRRLCRDVAPARRDDRRSRQHGRGGRGGRRRRRERRRRHVCSPTSTSAFASPPTRTDTSTRSACCPRAGTAPSAPPPAPVAAPVPAAGSCGHRRAPPPQPAPLRTRDAASVEAQPSRRRRPPSRRRRASGRRASARARAACGRATYGRRAAYAAVVRPTRGQADPRRRAAGGPRHTRARVRSRRSATGSPFVAEAERAREAALVRTVRGRTPRRGPWPSPRIGRSSRGRARQTLSNCRLPALRATRHVRRRASPGRPRSRACPLRIS